MSHMTPKQIAKRLDKIAILVNELDADLKAQFGEQAEVFFEADGGIHAMRGDSDGGASERQSFIIASSGHSCHGVGAW